MPGACTARDAVRWTGGSGARFFGLNDWSSYADPAYWGRLFGSWLFSGGEYISKPTPQQWAAEARKVLAEHGYSMDDGFAAFRAKIMKPLDVSVTTEHGTALFPK